ncbi:MAG: hypothetical protein LBG96_09820 [Tannerella sp.]|jgi:hypothetical protein|nr:hypothetical protein [Tannerella sp.]
MNKQFFCMLLIGALVLSIGTFVSCSDENDDLDSRLTVVEGMIREIKEQLENLPAGSTITSATQNNGIWTLVLSSGQTITINPSVGGGASLDVLEKENSIVITVDGKDYELPIGTGLHSLVYVPEFTDGEVRTGPNGRATVKFLVKPALTTATLENASFTIGAAHVLQTRSARELFNVDGKVTLDGDYINVPVRVLDTETAGKTYAVALQMNLSGAVYMSNYFNLVVSADFMGTPEDIVEAKLISAVIDYAELNNGFSTATLPESTVDVLGTFNFKDLFAELPEGTVRFELGARTLQNDNVTRDNRYEVFRNALSDDGTWELKARPGTNGDAPNDGQDGILINVIVDDVVKHKIYWKIADPIAALPDEAFAGTFDGSPHIEYPEDIVWEKGARLYNFNKEFTTGDFRPMHDGGNFVKAFGNYEVSVGANYLIYNDGEELQLGELGKKLAKHSKGLCWKNRQSSIAASQRRNLDIPDEQKGNGEIIGGYDGISTDEMWNTFGFRIIDTGIEMSDNYRGNALRAGVGLTYEYAYGERSIGHNGSLVFLWINRRVSPADVSDPAPR